MIGVTLNMEVTSELVKLLDKAATANTEGTIPGNQLAAKLKNEILNVLIGDKSVEIKRMHAAAIHNCLKDLKQLDGLSAEDFDQLMLVLEWQL